MTGNQATVESAKLDLSAVEGDWVSVTGVSYGITRFQTHRTDSGFTVRAYGGSTGPRPGDWGEVTANGVFAMWTGAGVVFTAEFENETMSSHVESYRSLGVLAVHVFHRFTDGSGRRDFFTRELYVPANGRTSGRRPGAAASPGVPPGLLTGDHDPSELLGSWKVLDAVAKTIPTLQCESAGNGEVTVRVQGVGDDGPVDWGTAAARVYTDGVLPDSPPGILTTFDRGDRLVHLEIRNFMGILVVGEYIQFTDNSGRTDHFIRECFAPA